MFGLNKLKLRYRKGAEARKQLKQRIALRDEILTNLAQREINERVRMFNKHKRSKYKPHQGKAEMARKIQESIK